MYTLTRVEFKNGYSGFPTCSYTVGTYETWQAAEQAYMTELSKGLTEKDISLSSGEFKAARHLTRKCRYQETWQEKEKRGYLQLVWNSQQPHHNNNTAHQNTKQGKTK